MTQPVRNDYQKVQCCRYLCIQKNVKPTTFALCYKEAELKQKVDVMLKLLCVHLSTWSNCIFNMKSLSFR